MVRLPNMSIEEWGRLVGLAAILVSAVTYLASIYSDPYIALLALLSVTLLLASSLISPKWLIIYALLYSALTGGPRLPDVPFFPVSIRGLFTSAILFASVLIMVFYRRRIDKNWFIDCAPFLLFLGIVWFRAVGSPSPYAIEDSILIATPILLYPIVRLVHKISDRDIVKLFLGTSTLPLVQASVGFVVGYTYLTNLGFYNPFGLRTLSLYLMVAIGLALAWARFSSGKAMRTLAIIYTIAMLVLLYLSLSRTVVAIVFGIMLPITLVAPNTILKWFFSAALGVLLAGLIFLTPYFQSRVPLQTLLTPDTQGLNSSGPEELNSSRPEGLNSSGRARIWSILADEAFASPLLGKGTGSAQTAVERITAQSDTPWDNPHNDFLRVFYDQGAFGLTFFLAAWLHRLWRHYNKWRLTYLDPRQRRINMAAFLAATGCLLSMLTSNTLLYVFILMPAFVLFALADEY